jgi:hypothetical protein
MEKQYKLPKKWTEEKWFPALLSGEYKQGMGSLYQKEDNLYCCLGVAGAVCGISNDIMNGVAIFTNEIANYPKELLETREDNCGIDLAGELASMNDNGDSSFGDIVVWIRENIELYDEE